MTPFLEKDDYVIAKYPSLQVYRFGFDFSVSDGDDEYDYEQFTAQDNSEMMKELVEYCEDYTKREIALLRPWVACNDRGCGSGYVKILMVFNDEYKKEEMNNVI